MALIKRFLEKRSTSPIDEWMRGKGDSLLSLSGSTVTESSSMQLAAVWACVRVISQTVASLPLQIYQYTADGQGKEKATKHELYRLLHTSPNTRMTAFQFKECMQISLLMWGNAFSWIEYTPGGKAKALWFLPPWRVQIKQTKEGDIFYQVLMPDRTYKNIPFYNMLHIAGMGWDGIQGFSVIGMQRETIGHNQAIQEYGSRFFSNGANPGGVVVHPKSLSDTAFDHLQSSLKEQSTGLENTHKLLLLEEGMNYIKTAMPNSESQLLELRKFSVLEICRIFGVPPHKVAEMTQATFSNIEHQSIEFVVDCISPWACRWEQAIDMRLLPANGKYFSKFNIAALLRGDSKSRWEAYKIAQQTGAYSINDILQLEDMNTIGNEGDIHLAPLNMIPIDKVNDFITALIASKTAGKGNTTADMDGGQSV